MFVADLHNDVVQRAMIGEDINQITQDGHTDLSRLVDSCIDLEVFVVWVSTISSNESYFEKANLMYDKIEQLINNHKSINISRNLQSIIENKKNNVLSISIGIEGGEAIENSLDKLYHFIQKGILYFGPTWNYSLDWVSSGYDEVNNKKIKQLGLSSFGKDNYKFM
jgi:Zn-dependent dipeptidase, microsomal dipeptidase homolog